MLYRKSYPSYSGPPRHIHRSGACRESSNNTRNRGTMLLSRGMKHRGILCKYNRCRQALSYLKSKYEQFSQNCDDTFSAKIRFGVLFTDEKNFDKDLKNIKGYFSSNVIDYISEVDTEKALIDEEKKMVILSKKLLFIEIKKKMMINGHFLFLK